jgi:hypothetical protein
VDVLSCFGGEIIEMSFSDAGRCVKYGASSCSRLFTGFTGHTSSADTCAVVVDFKRFGRKITSESASSSSSSSFIAGVSIIFGGVDDTAARFERRMSDFDELSSALG